MSKRVTSVVVEDCELVIKYSDCTESRYDLRDCDDDTPPSKKPGDSPDPFPQDDVRCRVAVKMAVQIVTNRYIDFLNAATPATVVSGGIGLAAVVSAKLAAWAWSALLYPDLFVYGFNVITTGDRDSALTEYNGAPQTVLDTVAEALYCVLPSTGAIDDATREAFRAALNDIGGATYTRLAEFLGIYPLERLRDEAFEASITTDAVDCAAFDCGEVVLPGDWCYEWDFVANGVDDWTINEGFYPGEEVGGIEGQDVDIEIAFDPPVTIHQTVMMAGGTGGTSNPWHLRVNGVSVWSGTFTDGENINGNTFENVSVIRVIGNRSFNWGITGMRLRGSGVSPFGESNCV